MDLILTETKWFKYRHSELNWSSKNLVGVASVGDKHSRGVVLSQSTFHLVETVLDDFHSITILMYAANYHSKLN